MTTSPSTAAAPLARRLLVCTALATAALGIPRGAAAEGQDSGTSSVAAFNGVVVHGVDTKQLAARMREADQRLVEGDAAQSAALLANLTTSDLDTLLEEREGVYLAAFECVALRVAKLTPEGLAAYRAAIDPRAAAALAEAVRTASPARLRHDAARLAYSTQGADLMLLLADLETAAGDTGAAVRALDDLLRLLPDHAPPEVLARAASRLAGLHASAGDAAAVRGIAGDLAAAVLDQPSPLTGAGTLRDELTRAAALAARRDPSPQAPGGPLTLAAELQLARSEFPPGDRGRIPGVLREHPVPVGTDAAPALLVRVQDRRGGPSHVAALAPSGNGTLAALWRWPPAGDTDPRPCVQFPFAPARAGDDLVAFTWAAPAREMRHPTRFQDAGEERHALVLLSASAEGKLVEERGVDESSRPDGDPELETLSFCGRPCVDGTAIYAAAIRRDMSREPTELHLCRFDLVREGRGVRLVLRWRRHLLDGLPLPIAIYRVSETEEVLGRVEPPSSPLVRGGRVFVSSNTGAVACVDAVSGRPEWIETYDRFGPSARITVVQSELATWDDAPLCADGPYLFAAPRDADALLQFRRARRRANALRVESFPFAGASGTAQRAGQIPENVVPTMLGGVRDGVVVLAGRVPRRPLGTTAPGGTPLIGFRLDQRDVLHAQVQEFASAGAPRLVGGTVLYPSPKAIYSVPLASFESPPAVLWQAPPPGMQARPRDLIGTLVPDGRRVWSVTPSRIVLLEPGR